MLFFTEPHRWTILKLCYWGLKIIYDLRTLPRYLKIRRHEFQEFSANRWQSMKFATTLVWLSIDLRLAIDANQHWLIDFHRLMDWFSDHRFSSIVQVLFYWLTAAKKVPNPLTKLREIFKKLEILALLKEKVSSK